MSSLVWSTDLKFAFQSLRDGMKVSLTALKADEAKVLTEGAKNSKTIKEAVQVYWN
jgi:hypothetical protein